MLTFLISLVILYIIPQNGSSVRPCFNNIAPFEHFFDGWHMEFDKLVEWKASFNMRLHFIPLSALNSGTTRFWYYSRSFLLPFLSSQYSCTSQVARKSKSPHFGRTKKNCCEVFSIHLLHYLIGINVGTHVLYLMFYTIFMLGNVYSWCWMLFLLI